ncbi:MAG: ribose-5-phosphate isomerase RpiA [Bryobacteraceae bacterium]
MSQDQLKSAAAESAAALVKDGMIVGLGSGSTAALAVNAIGKRVREGLRITGIPTSEDTAAQARALGIPLTDLGAVSKIDLTIDGADEVELGTLNLIKGHGGALLREKIVANVTQRMVVVVDDSKLVQHLAAKFPVPMEVVQFGWQATARQLEALGANPAMRQNAEGKPFISDGGHYILDCAFADVHAESLARELDHIVGLVEHGLFIGFAKEVHVAAASGVRIMTV